MVFYRFKDPDGIYMLRLRTNHSTKIFNRKVYRDVLIGLLDDFIKNKGLSIHAFLILDDHADLIISRKVKAVKLEGLLNNLLKESSDLLVKRAEENSGKSHEKAKQHVVLKRYMNKTTHNLLWSPDEPLILLDLKNRRDYVMQALDHLHNNPVYTAVVEKATDYAYSSARNYAGEKGLLDVDVLIV